MTPSDNTMKVWSANIARAALIVCLAFCLPHNAYADPWRDAQEANRAIEAWDYSEAQRLVNQLREQSPRNPSVQFVGGKLDFHLGNYERAIEQLQAAREDIPSQAMHAVDQLLDLVRSTLEVVRSYQTYVSEDGHFEIRHEPRDAFLVPYIAETLEEAYYAVGFALGYWPQGPIRVEIYPKAHLLSRVSSLPEEAVKTTSTIGLCKYNKLMVTSPRGTVRGYRWRDTLSHEYVHLVISQKTRNRVPIWLHEGIAKHTENRWRSQDPPSLEPAREDVLAQRIEANNLVSLEQMSPSIALLPSQEDATVAYAEVFTVVEYLVQQRGQDAIRRVLDAIRDGRTTEEAIEEISGLAWRDFERRWMRWLTHERPRVKTPIDFDDEPVLQGSDEAADEGEFAGVQSPKARDHLKLGELLRARGFLDAALTEYRRAEAILGPVHPMVQNGAAAVLIEQGDNEAVLEALQDATEWFPSYYVSHVYKAQALNRLGHFQEALDETDEALSINPFDPRVFEERVRALEGLSQTDELARAKAALQQLQKN